MKILHTSDWHLGKIVLVQSMLDDQRYFIENVFLKALDEYRPDVIVLAGKGHEDYQEICGKKYPMDERVLIADILAEDAKKEN